MPFLRTVREGATDRSYGVHVANLAGVPAPVVERSRDVLDRLCEKTAIEAKGSGSETSLDETVQAVFDLGGGEFTNETTADGGSDPEALDPTTESVLSELEDIDVADTPPVDLLSRVQERSAAGGVTVVPGIAISPARGIVSSYSNIIPFITNTFFNRRPILGHVHRQGDVRERGGGRTRGALRP